MAGNKSDLNFFIWSATELDRFCGVNGSAWGTTKKVIISGGNQITG